MIHRASPRFDRILESISTIPVIDTHEHMFGPPSIYGNDEPIAGLAVAYFRDDLTSAGLDRGTRALLADPSVETERKWPAFEAFWRRTEHTAYARQIKLILEAYGETGMSLPALLRVGERLATRDTAFYLRTLDDAGIVMVLADALEPTSTGMRMDAFAEFLSGKLTFPERWRLLVPLAYFHAIRMMECGVGTWMGVQQVGALVDRNITSLDEFLECVFEVLKKAKERGAIGLKAGFAYLRSLDYEVVPRCDAEPLFNRMLSDPRALLPWPEAKPLDDFLFHQYMRFGRDLDLPVQVHTGHMAMGLGTNRVDKANAAHFARVMELHQDVRFDLFHGNWPYMGDLLFLGKNYPNAAIDCCWLHIIDPLYAERLLERAVVTVPHSKVHGFGGDHGDFPELAATHLKMAREVIASALANLVERGWLDEEQAAGVATDWLFNNPNRFFKLGLEPIGTGR